MNPTMIMQNSARFICPSRVHRPKRSVFSRGRNSRTRYSLKAKNVIARVTMTMTARSTQPMPVFRRRRKPPTKTMSPVTPMISQNAIP